MTFQKAWESLALACMAACGIYASNKLGDLTNSVASLNSNVAVLLERTGVQQVRTDNLESRMNSYEAAARGPSSSR